LIIIQSLNQSINQSFKNLFYHQKVVETAL